MNIKRIYGAILTLLGIGGLVYAAVSLISSTGLGNIMAHAIYGILGLTFLIAGINLMRAIKKIWKVNREPILLVVTSSEQSSQRR